MTEDPQLLLPPDQNSDPTPEVVRQPDQAQDYVTELRQELVREEAAEKEQGGTSGRLIRRITGSLKRVTGPLGTGSLRRQPKTENLEPQESAAQPTSEAPPAAPPERPAPLGVPDSVEAPPALEGTASSEATAAPDASASFEPPTSPEVPTSLETPASPEAAASPEATPSLKAPEAPDMTDDFLSGRLGDLSVKDTHPHSPERSWDQPADAVEDAAFEPVDFLPEPPGLEVLEDVEAGVEESPAEEAPGSEANWMAEIRQEVVSTPIPEADKPAPRQTTGPLRSLLTGILRLREDKGKPTGEPEMDDDLLTGRLERSLTVYQAPEEVPGAAEPPEGTITDPLMDERVAPQAEEAEPVKRRDEMFVPRNEEILLDGMRLPDPSSTVGQTEYAADLPIETVPDRMPSADIESTLGPEVGKEQPQEEPTITPAPLRPVIAFNADDAFAIEFLTGQQAEIAYPDQEESLLHKVLEQKKQPSPPEPMGELREIALQDYEEAQTPEYRLPEEGLSPPPETTTQWKTWFASRTFLEKALLIEAAVILVVLLVAGSYSLYSLARGPETAAFTPRSLPEGLPHPTGLTLTGGWSFPLSKSTFEDGQWRPAGSEWLEGTELRRVVALPWNRQTEAVIQTLKPGDEVQLNLSNEDDLFYRVNRIERVPVDDTTVLLDQEPSLVIILYNEGTPDRWVVFCQP